MPNFLLVFGRLGIGSIVAFLVAGLLVGMIRDLPDAWPRERVLLPISVIARASRTVSDRERAR